MNDAHNAIVEWQNKQINGTQLIRRLVSYDKWNVPISEAAAVEMLNTNYASKIMYHQAPDGTKKLLLYTDAESYAQSVAGITPAVAPQHFLTTTGKWIFQHIIGEFKEILINPQTPTFISYQGLQIDLLHATASSVEIDEYLALLRQGTGPEGSVRSVGEYRAYSIAIRKLDGQTSICYAPDDKQRKLIAVFTADDAFEAYYYRLPESIPGEVSRVRIPGRQLFPHLQEQTADGIVFNCCGPSKPVAFAMGLCGVILGELPPIEPAAK